MTIEKSNLCMRLKLIEDCYSRCNKRKKEKLSEKLRYDETKNEGNCFLFSLLSISKAFTIRKNKKTFKNEPICVQINKANEILSIHNQKLIQVNETIEIFGDYIKTCKGPSIVVVDSDLVIMHSEAIIDYSISKYYQKERRYYKKMRLRIKEFQIVNIAAINLKSELAK